MTMHWEMTWHPYDAEQRCWADIDPFHPLDTVYCTKEATSPIGLCAKHHREITGNGPDPVPLELVEADWRRYD